MIYENERVWVNRDIYRNRNPEEFDKPLEYWLGKLSQKFTYEISQTCVYSSVSNFITLSVSLNVYPISQLASTQKVKYHVRDLSELKHLVIYVTRHSYRDLELYYGDSILFSSVSSEGIV